jgi:hypothetical protein
MDYVEELSRKCNLPPQPQQGALKKLLAEILEEHFPVNSTKIQQDEYISVKDVNEKFQATLDEIKSLRLYLESNE